MELLDIARKYAIIENRLLGALMMKWQDAKMSNLEYYVIADINPQYWPQNKVKIPECIQPHVAAAMSLGSRRALTLLQTHSRRLDLVAASPEHEDMQGMQQKLNGDITYLINAHHIRSFAKSMMTYYTGMII